VVSAGVFFVFRSTCICICCDSVSEFLSQPDCGAGHTALVVVYVVPQHMATQQIDNALKKGSAELLALSLVEHRPRHGYEIGKLIESRSKGTLCFQVASLYPLLYRLEARGWIQGRWVEKAGQRRRRYYRITTEGRKVLAAQRRGWQQFVEAIRLITGADYA
jgi:PadR family transcriptional regulator PadR